MVISNNYIKHETSSIFENHGARTVWSIKYKYVAYNLIIQQLPRKSKHLCFVMDTATKRLYNFKVNVAI